jgi:filamentous hemagglutinin
MAGRADVFKRWGVTIEAIRAMRSRTISFTLKHASHGAGMHGRRLSGTFHNELKTLIDDSKSFPEFKSRLRHLADRWLTGGRKDLPIGLQ